MRVWCRWTSFNLAPMLTATAARPRSPKNLAPSALQLPVRGARAEWGRYLAGKLTPELALRPTATTAAAAAAAAVAVAVAVAAATPAPPGRRASTIAGADPAEVAAALGRPVAPVPGANESNAKPKHGTQVATIEAISVALTEVRDSALFRDRNPEHCHGALASCSCYENITPWAGALGKARVDSWNSTYFAIAFPPTIP